MGYKVAVLMGGSSFERKISLASGKQVFDALTAAGHEVLPLDVKGDLVPTLRQERPDVAYVAVHGNHGEDGTIQSLLEFLQIPYVGSTAATCRMVWNKANLPAVLSRADEGTRCAAHVPCFVCLSADAIKDMGAAEALDLVEERIPGGYPVCVKPARGGSSLGISKVASADELGEALMTALAYDDQVLVQQWVDGVEVAVSVLGSGDDIRVLPPVEIVPPAGHAFFDTDARFEEDPAWFHAPVRLESLAPEEADAQSIRSELERAALDVYLACGARDLGRIDLIWDGAQAHALELSLSPGMGPGTRTPVAVEAAGIEVADVLDVLVRGAVERGPEPLVH